MKLPLQITYRDMDSSNAITEHVRRQSQKLDTFCERIMSCRVVVEATARHSHNGRQFRVRLDVKVPHKELVAVETGEGAGDVYGMIDAAFETMAREVEAYNRTSRWDHKRRSLHRRLDARAMLGSTARPSMSDGGDRPSVI